MQLEWLDAAEIVKITHVAEIVNIRHVAIILKAEICGAENVCAILVYNQYYVLYWNFFQQHQQSFYMC